MSDREPNHSEIGAIGEGIVCRYLEDLDYEVIARNYRKKAGEIDIIALDSKKNLHFVEVKTVSRENFSDVTCETGEGYRPEDNLHPNKLKRLGRTIQIYLAEKGVSQETVWFFDVCLVYLTVKDRKAKVNFIKDIILN